MILIFCIYLFFWLIILLVTKMDDKYNDIVDKHSPKEDRLKNAIVCFVAGGIFGVLAELLLRGYMVWFSLPRKEAGVVVTLTLVVVASVLTALGIFDVCVAKLKSALIIPITGFAHSMTAAALEYRKEGLVLGIGANIFKLAGTVILYGIVSVYIFGLVRLLVMGG
jgi:stage V sporulation protein AC